MTKLIDVLTEEYYLKPEHSHNIDNHGYVQSWLNDYNNKEYQIKAYLVRDLKYDECRNIRDYFHDHCHKLGWNLSDQERTDIKKNTFLHNIREMISNNSLPNESIQTLYNNHINSVSNTEKTNKERYHRLLHMIDEGSHPYEIYNEFTKGELDYLGW